jgi:maltooligosyltrehalose trehalohydrolase
VADNGLLTASWRMGDGATLRLTANLSTGEMAHKRSETTGTPIWGGETSNLIPQWSVFWRLEAR